MIFSKKKNAIEKKILRYAGFLFIAILFLWGGCQSTILDSEQLSDRIQKFISASSIGYWALFGQYFIAVIAGLATCLTPCVYPLIPITMAIFGARGKNVSHLQAIGLSLSYILGLAVMYTSLGVFYVIFIGGKFGSFMANPYVMFPIIALFVFMAMSMLGFFTLSLPLSWQTALTKVGGKGGFGAFSMGLVAGIIAAPCTAAPLAQIFALIGSQKALWIGASTLFFYAIGIGLPFLLIAAFALKLPKSGNWLEVIKGLWGVVLLVTALYYARNLFPLLMNYGQPTTVFLAIHLFIALFSLLVGGFALKMNHLLMKSFLKYLSVLLLVLGGFGTLSWFLSYRENLNWNLAEKTILDTAKKEGKPVLIDFSAKWCMPCQELAKVTFSDRKVEENLRKYKLIKIDCTDFSETCEEWRKNYKVETLPHLIFIDSRGEIIHRIQEFVGPEKMIKALEKIH